MSIWNKCDKYGAEPFYGFPVIPSIKNNELLFEFPEGYCPNGNQTQEVAENLLSFVGEEILEIAENRVRIKIDSKKLAMIIYQHQFEHKGA